MLKLYIYCKKIGKKIQKSDSQKNCFFIGTFQEQMRWSAPIMQNSNFSAFQRNWAVM